MSRVFCFALALFSGAVLVASSTPGQAGAPRNGASQKSAPPGGAPATLALNGAPASPTLDGAPATLTLDGAAITHTFTGHGGLSAGASSRLLWDYPTQQRADILDMLFTPQHGMSLHILKTEIGGDAQSTDGTEPSHEHARGDLSCTRGYERFLIKEAKARNPAIKIYGLSWGAPGWINNGSSFFGPEMTAYQAQWVRCIKEDGFDVDYIGVRSESRAFA